MHEDYRALRDEDEMGGGRIGGRVNEVGGEGEDQTLVLMLAYLTGRWKGVS